MAEPTIGKRIRELRRPLFTQIDLAVAADVSVDVIRKLEQGRRRTASIATLARIASVLGVDLVDLLGPSRPVLAASSDQDQVIAIRDALTSVDDLLGELDDADAPDLTEFGRAVTYAFGLYWAGRYGPLTAMLPRLLTEAAAAITGPRPADSARRPTSPRRSTGSRLARCYTSARPISATSRPEKGCGGPRGRRIRCGPPRCAARSVMC